MKKPSSKLKVIIILGPPGSGKGTQAELLAETFGFYHLETSEIIEKNLAKAKKDDFVQVGGKKYFLYKERKLRDSGKWMSPPLISFWVKSKIKALAKEDEEIIFSGSPKTLHEARELIPLLKKLYGQERIRVILMEQEPEVSIWRNTRRRICELMRHSIIYTQENAKLKKCPLDGSKLIRREDGTPKMIKEKLEEFEERTLPLIDYFKQKNLKVIKINGDQTVSEVFEDILKVLK